MYIGCTYIHAYVMYVYVYVFQCVCVCACMYVCARVFVGTCIIGAKFLPLLVKWKMRRLNWIPYNISICFEKLRDLFMVDEDISIIGAKWLPRWLQCLIHIFFESKLLIFMWKCLSLRQWKVCCFTGGKVLFHQSTVMSKGCLKWDPLTYALTEDDVPMDYVLGFIRHLNGWHKYSWWWLYFWWQLTLSHSTCHVAFHVNLWNEVLELCGLPKAPPNKLLFITYMKEVECKVKLKSAWLEALAI